MLRHKTDVYFMPRAVRQFFRCQRKRKDLGSIDTARHELIVYIREHLAAGCQYDPKSQEILYCNGVTMYLREDKGTWLVVKVVLSDKEQTFAPVYLWTTIRQGASRLARRVFHRWVIRNKQPDPTPAWGWACAL